MLSSHTFIGAEAWQSKKQCAAWCAACDATLCMLVRVDTKWCSQPDERGHTDHLVHSLHILKLPIIGGAKHDHNACTQPRYCSPPQPSHHCPMYGDSSAVKQQEHACLLAHDGHEMPAMILAVSWRVHEAN